MLNSIYVDEVLISTSSLGKRCSVTFLETKSIFLQVTTLFQAFATEQFKNDKKNAALTVSENSEFFWSEYGKIRTCKYEHFSRCVTQIRHFFLIKEKNITNKQKMTTV